MSHCLDSCCRVTSLMGLIDNFFRSWAYGSMEDMNYQKYHLQFNSNYRVRVCYHFYSLVFQSCGLLNENNHENFDLSSIHLPHKSFSRGDWGYSDNLCFKF